MKVVVFAAGQGSRLSLEEVVVMPKPLVEVDEKPILWHVMKIYSHYGFNEFVVLTGYKSYMIKQYFANFNMINGNVKFDVKNNVVECLNNEEKFIVTCVDIQKDDQTGGALLRAKEHINNEQFMLAYSDTLADVDINAVLKFHNSDPKKICTMTSVVPEGKYGAVEFDENNIATSFVEKPKHGNDWVNAGFFVCEPEIFDYIQYPDVPFESTPLENLVNYGQLKIYQHRGFYKCMDTMKDKKVLNELSEKGEAKWKVWE